MAVTQNINYLQPTAFKLVIDRVNYPNLEFFAQSVNHPSVTMTGAELSYPRISSVAMPGDKLTFGELSATIILDEDMNGYIEMFDWMQRMVETEYRSPLSRTAAVVPSQADITLNILTSHSNANKQIKYIDCIPTAVGDINFESTVSDVTYITFGVSFKFTYFQIT